MITVTQHRSALKAAGHAAKRRGEDSAFRRGAHGYMQAAIAEGWIRSVRPVTQSGLRLAPTAWYVARPDDWLVVTPFVHEPNGNVLDGPFRTKKEAAEAVLNHNPKLKVRRIAPALYLYIERVKGSATGTPYWVGERGVLEHEGFDVLDGHEGQP